MVSESPSHHVACLEQIELRCCLYTLARKSSERCEHRESNTGCGHDTLMKSSQGRKLQAAVSTLQPLTFVQLLCNSTETIKDDVSFLILFLICLFHVFALFYCLQLIWFYWNVLHINFVSYCVSHSLLDFVVSFLLRNFNLTWRFSPKLLFNAGEV
jgi:hypothetical protein